MKGIRYGNGYKTFLYLAPLAAMPIFSKWYRQTKLEDFYGLLYNSDDTLLSAISLHINEKYSISKNGYESICLVPFQKNDTSKVKNTHKVQSGRQQLLDEIL